MSELSPQISTPISWGEFLDKITILQIKSERINDQAKLKNVAHELEALLRIQHPNGLQAEAQTLVSKLKKVNEDLWTIEDDIRICEKDQDFGDRFIELARSVYKQNDKRAALKKEINLLLGSDFVEEKSYEDYGA